MRLYQRYERLSFWNKVGFWGAIASILGLVLAVVLPLVAVSARHQNGGIQADERRDLHGDAFRIDIARIEVSTRDPLWGYESFDSDEVIAKVSGTARFPGVDPNAVIIGFWRLANDYVTDWHAGRRRQGSNYRVAMLDASVAHAGDWEFLIGGIECEKAYSGDIAIVLLLYPRAIIDSHTSEWEREHGWGFRELPSGYLATSAVRTFKTMAVRK